MQQSSFWSAKDRWSLRNKVGQLSISHSSADHNKEKSVCVFVKTLKREKNYLVFNSPLWSIGFSFSPWNPAVHEEAKERMFTYKVSFAKLKLCTFEAGESLICIFYLLILVMQLLICYCCPRDDLRITTRHLRHRVCLG